MTAGLAALSLSSQIEKYGAYAGIAAVVGLGVLALLYFAQAREVKRLREWAGRAPERDAELQQRAVAEAQRRAVQPAPRAQPARPAGPATPAAVAAAAAKAPGAAPPAGPGAPGSQPGTPTGPKPPVPATAAAAAGATAAAVTAAGTPSPAGASPATPGAAAPPAAPGATPAATPAVAPATPAPAKPAVAAAGATVPSATPAKPPSGDAPAPAMSAATPAAPAAPAEPPAAPADPPARPPAVSSPTPPPPAPPRPRPRPAAAPVRATRQEGPVTPREGTRPPAQPGSHRGLVAVIVGTLAIAAVAVLLITQVFSGDDAPTTEKPNSVGTPTTSASGDGGSDTAARPQPKRETTQVAVFNGTTVTGLARAAADKLTAAGYKNVSPVTTDTTNQARATTVVYWQSGSRREGVDVAKLIGVSRDALQPMDQNARVLGGGAPVVVIVGADQAQ